MAKSNGKRYPAGHRVTTEPFHHSGVVVDPGSNGCLILLDEPLAHTNHVYRSWDEVWDEGDHEIYRAEFRLVGRKWRVANTLKNLQAAQAAHDEARAQWRKGRAELQDIKEKYGRA
jgi:hypothetical protein